MDLTKRLGECRMDEEGRERIAAVTGRGWRRICKHCRTALSSLSLLEKLECESLRQGEFL